MVELCYKSQFFSKKSHFFSILFGYIRKILYLCTIFRLYAYAYP